MERIFALFIRAGLAAIFGFMFGTMFMIGTFWVIPPAIIPPMWALSLSVGFGCGLAAFICFIKPEANISINLLTFVIASLSGVFGGYLGSLLADPEGVRNVRLVASSITSPDVAPFVYMGTFISTVFTSAWYAYRLWLYNED
ncbi:MAG: hypothetical protein VX982_06065 [Chloroflexota bacterium]|nr:hypothetical protein [Chloroflexota bacterium]MEC9365457.1 hypothetical protein [Chloroflexota bacterium]MED5450649.1 hypothetical protein [Chloroflexota bacterium]MED6296566.1 hypothetical protein [Chloroflexota bacterium]|tara:strand:- start:3767 stop:4192 length:426 start_codon:yes stop_codon:yes gene_type:complete